MNKKVLIMGLILIAISIFTVSGVVAFAETHVTSNPYDVDLNKSGSYNEEYYYNYESGEITNRYEFQVKHSSFLKNAQTVFTLPNHDLPGLKMYVYVKLWKDKGYDEASDTQYAGGLFSGWSVSVTKAYSKVAETKHIVKTQDGYPNDLGFTAEIKGR